MLRAIKIRIYPNKEQISYINRQLGCCRFVYNNCLEYKDKEYKLNNVSVSPTDLIKRLSILKNDFNWLKDVHSKVLQQSIRDLNQAFTNFFNERADFPNFKCKHDNRQSCRFPSDAFIGIRGNRIDIIKALKDIHFKCSNRDEIYLNKNQDKVKSITLKKEPCGEFYLSILIDGDLIHKELKSTNNSVGIDIGIKDFVITSDGEVFNNLHFKKSQSNKIKRFQRELSCKEKGSRNRNKARIRLAKLYKKINDKKLNYLHQISNSLIDENQVICMEDLNVKGMVKIHNLAESIQEMNFGEFRRMLEYKANWYGRHLVFVDRFYPSSKTCHHCGYIKKDLKLSDRTWICP